MVLPVKGGRTKVDQFDPGISHPSDVSLGIGTVFRIPIVGYKQNIFWLQIRMGQVVVMKKLQIIISIKITFQECKHFSRSVCGIEDYMNWQSCNFSGEQKMKITRESHLFSVKF